MTGRSGRGGGRGRGGRRDMPRDQQVSRALSRLLRHSAQQEGLVIGKGGYASLQDVLNTRPLKSIQVTFSEVKEVVADNDKQRFSLILASSLKDDKDESAPPPVEGLETQALKTIAESDNPSDYLIRANQGHSIKVDTEGLLTPITEEAGNIPAVCVHGTNDSSWQKILGSGGLNKMARNHIHFASGLPAGFKSMAQDGASTDEKEAPPVISGMRKSSTILIYVNIRQALDNGIKFFISENGVILTEGNEEGFVPSSLFERVENRERGGGVLMEKGQVPIGTVVDLESWKKEVGDSKGGRRGGGHGRGGRGGRGSGGGRGGKARVNDDSSDLLAGM